MSDLPSIEWLADEANNGQDEPRQEPSVEELCAADGHGYEGDDGGVGRCYCGLQQYPKGGPPR